MPAAFPKGRVWKGDVGDYEVAIRSDGARPQLWVDVGHGRKGRYSKRKSPESVLPYIEAETGVAIAALPVWMPDDVIKRLSTPFDSLGGADETSAPMAQELTRASSGASGEVNSGGSAEVAAEPDPFGALAETMAGVESAGGETGIRRSSRKRSPTQMLDPADKLKPGERFRLEGGRATGQRRALAEEKECMRPRCVAARAENDRLREKLEAETNRRAALSQIRSPPPCTINQSLRYSCRYRSIHRRCISGCAPTSPRSTRISTNASRRPRSRCSRR
eukprot:1016477-Prymnesium_polylepis.1